MGDEREAVARLMEERQVRFVSMQFVDIFGNAKSCELTAKKFHDSLDTGRWFDGSSIEGFVRIFESDMLLKPDLKTFVVMPLNSHGVARVMCDVYVDEEKPFEGDPRFILKRALSMAREKGFEYKVGPELEFFLFKMNGDGKPAAAPHDDGGYFDLSPMDMAGELRQEMTPALESVGMEIEMGHHECSPGQHEIDFKYGDPVSAADNVITYKNLVKSVARKHGLFASFMPKPIFGVNGSGMHVHQSLWKGEKNAFYDDGDARRLSKAAYSFIAGQLAHARSLAAVVAPTVNSYKRLVPGFEAPVYICWGEVNRSALIRIPRYMKGREYARRIELRCPDPSCNPYLAFTAMLWAGMDGMEKGMTPPEPVEEDVYEFDDRRLAEKYISTLPGSLGEAMEELGKSELMKKALGEHIHSKLLEAQKEQWDSYRRSVTPWELERYLPVV